MASSLEGTITKYKRKPNLLEDFINAIETGHNSIVKEAGNVVYSEYENWAKEKNYSFYPSGLLPNLNEDNKIVSYSMPSYGYAWADRQKNEGQPAKITAGLLKTYNRLYFLLDTKDLDVITLTFQNIGKKLNELEKDQKTSVDYAPRIWGGIIPKNLFNENTFKEFLNQSDEEVMKKTQRIMQLTDESLNAEFSALALDLRELKNIEGTECYVIITNIESGDLWENPEFDPNNDTEPAFTPYYTCSAPDLIEVQSIVYNKAPTIPSNIDLYHNGDVSLYPDIPKGDLIEGIETCIEWTPSEDIDETPKLDTLNMGSFILPPGFSRGDINKDGKIDEKDYNRLVQIINNNETLNDDGFGLWAAIISKLGENENNKGAINADSKELMNNHLNGTSQIKSEVFRGNNWDCEWKVDINNNLYYIDIPDERIHPEVKIELYNEYLYDLGTLQKIECYDKYFRIYLNCCPTNNLFIEDNYDGENNGTLLQEKWEELKKLESTKKIFNVEYKIITESYKKNLLKRNKSDNIVYELILEYDNEDIEKYWILPKDKDYLDMGFIQDLYYEYCFVYSERSEKENYNKFLKLLPQKTLFGYELNKNGKLFAVLPPISEEKQFLNNSYMFRTQINKIQMASIDYYGEKSIYENLVMPEKQIHYLSNTEPEPPVKTNFLQNKNEINLTAIGAFDNDTNEEYKVPNKDVIRYQYEYYDNKLKEFIPVSSFVSEELKEIPITALGDYTMQGKINDLSLIRLSAYMHTNFIPSAIESSVFLSLNGDQTIDKNDIDLLKKYINSNEHIVFKGLSTYKEDHFNPNLNKELAWELNSDTGLYITSFDISLPDEFSPISLYIYNYYLNSLETFVKGEIERTENSKQAKAYLYFKEIPDLTSKTKIRYSIEKNLTKDEVKLYKYTQWYPTPATFTINKRPDEVEYITARARATDRMAWSDWKEFKGVAYPDIWLGVRNYINTTNFSSNGNTSINIPSPISNLKFSSNTLTWTNPIEDDYYETVIIQKPNSKPTSITDGVEIYRGTNNNITISNLENSITYYWAGFSINKNGDYKSNYPVISYTPSEPIPSTISNFIVNGVGYTANLSWTNPTDDTYYKTIIVQKINSAPTNIADGEEVYRGTKTEIELTLTENSTKYFWAAFAIDAKGKYHESFPTISYTTPTFPVKPNSYSLIEQYNESATIIVPEDGWYQLEIHGKSGDGGSGDGYTSSGDYGTTIFALASGGGGGGGGAYVLSNNIKLNESDTIDIKYGTSGNITVTINNTTNEVYNVMQAGVGGKGGNGDAGAYGGSGGAGGSAKGGNAANINGSSGGTGTVDEGTETNTSSASAYGKGGKGGAPGHVEGNAGGNGESYANDGVSEYAGKGKPGFVNFYRGNTNLTPGGNDSSSFPSQPSSYSLINTYTSNTTFTAPEDGWYKLVLQGASGNGGNGYSSDEGREGHAYVGNGAGGGGGGCTISEVKLKKNDTVNYIHAEVGNICKAIINSSVETYSTMQVTSGANGEDCSGGSNAEGGLGGIGSGGDYEYSGERGEDGVFKIASSMPSFYAPATQGGAAGYNDGNIGGTGGSANYTCGYTDDEDEWHEDAFSQDRGSSGLASFMQIYQGN